jgi:hypothetical protein
VRYLEPLKRGHLILGDANTDLSPLSQSGLLVLVLSNKTLAGPLGIDSALDRVAGGLDVRL